MQQKPLHEFLNLCVLLVHTIYEETEVIAAAREVSKSNVGMFCCVKGIQEFLTDNLHGASHRPMAICLIHNSRIVDEGYSIDCVVREETQILLLPLSPFSISCRGSIQLRVVPFRSSRAHSQHVRWKRNSGIVIHTGLSLT